MKKPVKIAPSDESLPDFMSDDVGYGRANFGPEDMIWCGDDYQLDPEQLLREHRWHPEAPLEAILRAIIEAHPVENKPTNDERLEIALKALTGVKRKRGMDQRDDYGLLCIVARRYWVEWCAGNKAPSVARIIEKYILERLERNYLARNNLELNSLVPRHGRMMRAIKPKYLPPQWIFCRSVNLLNASVH